MIVGIPKEVKNHEYRVAATPEGYEPAAEVVEIAREAEVEWTLADFDRIGADYNAFTSEENTCYFATVNIASAGSPTTSRSIPAAASRSMKSATTTAPSPT